MERFYLLNRYQRILLLILAVMTVLSIPLYILAASQVGFLHCDELFIPVQGDGITRYEAKVDNVDSVITVTSDTVTLTRGAKTYGPYTLMEDPTAVPEDHSYMTGIVILDGKKTYFRGGVSDEREDFWLISADGDYPVTMTYTVSGGMEYDIYGNPIDPMEPSPYQIISLLRGPELVHRGHWEIWFMGLLCAIITLVSILFADELFYLSICFRVQNAEYAEPSDWAVATRNFGWLTLTVAAGVFYLMGLQV